MTSGGTKGYLNFKMILTQDENTRSLVTVDYDHKEIHSGSAFQVMGQKDQTISHCRDIQITCGTKDMHFTFAVGCEKETIVRLYEDVTFTLAGTAFTPLNKNRASTKTSLSTFAVIDNASVADATTDTPIVSATLLEDFSVIEGKKGGGSGITRDEWILKPGKLYSLRFESTVAGVVSYWLDWYEHTSKA